MSLSGCEPRECRRIFCRCWVEKWREKCGQATRLPVSVLGSTLKCICTGIAIASRSEPPSRISSIRCTPEAPALRPGLLISGEVRSENHERGGRSAAAYSMSFLRHEEIYPSDGGAHLPVNASPHRLDEFPAG